MICIRLQYVFPHKKAVNPLFMWRLWTAHATNTKSSRSRELFPFSCSIEEIVQIPTYKESEMLCYLEKSLKSNTYYIIGTHFN